MECLVARFIATLDARTHTLLADVAIQLPSSLWYFFNVHDRLHECMITKGDFWNPHGTQKMSPFGRVCLFERAVGVWTEDASLRT